VKNLDEKLDDLKVEVKDLHDCLDRNMDETKVILKEFQEANTKSHDELAEKLSSLEKIKWMLMGAAAVLGATGVEAFKMIVNG
jgi:predicted nuclease with TOPRIM domain